MKMKESFWNLEETREELLKKSKEELIEIISGLDEGLFESNMGEDL